MNDRQHAQQLANVLALFLDQYYQGQPERAERPEVKAGARALDAWVAHTRPAPKQPELPL